MTVITPHPAEHHSISVDGEVYMIIINADTLGRTSVYQIVNQGRNQIFLRRVAWPPALEKIVQDLERKYIDKRDKVSSANYETLKKNLDPVRPKFIPANGWPYPWTSQDAAMAEKDGWILSERADGYYEIQRLDINPFFSTDFEAMLFVRERIDSEFYAKAWHLHGTKVPDPKEDFRVSFSFNVKARNRAEATVEAVNYIASLQSGDVVEEFFKIEKLFPPRRRK